MAQTLEEFMAELRTDVDRFEKWWREMNTKEPDYFPLVLPDGNEGVWFESFTNFALDGESETSG